MSVHDHLERLCRDRDLLFVVAVNEEGLSMAQAGDVPEDEFSPYMPMAAETTRRLARSGGFGDPVCSALVLDGGRMLLLNQMNVAGNVVYLALMARKTPRNLKALWDEIGARLGDALGAASDEGGES